MERRKQVVKVRPPSLPLNEVQLKQRDSFLRKLASGVYHLESVRACVCGSDQAMPVTEGDRFGLPVGIVMCRGCGLMRTSPRLAAEHLPAFYEDDYHRLHMGTMEPKAALYHAGQGAAVYEQLRQYLSPGKLTVVEVGAGTGDVLREFAAAAAADGRKTQLTGCEYSSQYSAQAQQLGTDVRIGGLEALEHVKAPDVIILSHVVEHFADLPGDLSRLRGLCGKKTLIYIEVPGVLTIHERPEYDFELVSYFTLAHTFHFTLETLSGAMAFAGFDRLAGDQQVRSVFKAAAAGRTSDTYENAFEKTRAYLAWLQSSPGLRGSRFAMKSRRWLRRAVRDIAGESGVQAVRRLKQGLRRAA